MQRPSPFAAFLLALLFLVAQVAATGCSGARDGGSETGAVPATPTEGLAQATEEELARATDEGLAPATEAAQEDPAMKRPLSKSGYDVAPYSKQRVAELAQKLDKESFRVTQNSGTEPAFCGNLVDNHKHGTYVCVVCGLPLFSSDSKFDSGTGWPSFFQPFDPAHVSEKSDATHGMVRTEINCARCAAHLGHVFDDGPRPTGLRYCLNSASLTFFERGAELPPESRPALAQSAAGGAAAKTETAYFAGGCFWGIEHWFQEGPGVISAESGYMQGHVDRPTYSMVCDHGTGHAEAVKVVFDPSKISYRRLLEAFFVMHDPTQLNRQGPDYGDQYRSGIFTAGAEQERTAKEFVAELAKSGRYGSRPIVTVVEPAQTFWPAEDYHQDYVAKTGRACHVTNPWTEKAPSRH